MEMNEKRYADAAAAYLARRGYEVLERDWECPSGRCDIIANDEDGALVFVEVSGSADAERGFPPEGISAEKRSRYERVALAYLADYEVTDVPAALRRDLPHRHRPRPRHDTPPEGGVNTRAHTQRGRAAISRSSFCSQIGFFSRWQPIWFQATRTCSSPVPQ